MSTSGPRPPASPSEQWGQGPPALDDGATLVDLLAAQADLTPHARAVDDGRQAVTYAELWHRVIAAAALLREHGAGPQASVVICADRCTDLVVAIVATVVAGAAYVPVDPSWPAARRDYVIGEVGPAAILTDRDLSGATRPVVRLVDLPGGSMSTPADSPSGPADGRDLVPARLLTDRDPAYVMYTSGSTGRPKGVVVPHRGVVNRLRWMQQEFGLTTADTVLQKTPYTFDVSVWEFFWPLLAGARLYVAEPEGHRDPEYLIQTIQKESITVIHFVPSMLAMVVQQPGLDRCPSLRLAVASGEALSAALATTWQAASTAELVNLYGPTEASIDVTCWRCRRPEPGPMVPIGRPITGVRLLVAHEGEPVGVGVAGELYLGGVCLADGYLGRPDLTEQAFPPDPGRPGERLYRTGDLVRWTADGVLEYLGRIDTQVKLHGVRIELGEIEALALEHPGVAQAAAAIQDDGQGSRLVLYVVAAPAALSGTAGAELSGLRGALRAQLPPAMVPTSIIELADMPLTSSGKCDRRALPTAARRDSATRL